jgi:hypothetical protein
MNRRTALLGLAIAALPQLGFAQSDPFLGTWQLNLAKSKYSPGPPPRSETWTLQADGQGRRDTMTGVSAAGNPKSLTFTVVFDGLPHPIVPPIACTRCADAYAATQIDAYTQIYSITKAGKLIEITSDVVSPDGKTATATVIQIDANGQKVFNVLVYEKQ